MKQLFILIFLSVMFNSLSFSQNNSCCGETSAPTKMASFSNDEKFRDAHPLPVPFNLTDGKGEMITFITSDGKTANAYEIKKDITTNKWLLIFHEWYGLNDYIKKESDELFTSLGDVNILAIDLYDGKVASNNEEASKYVKEVDVTRAINIIRGASDYCGKDAIFATLGWCFGGSWSNQASIILEDKCKASVIYYGTPESDTTRLKKIYASVLGIFAKQDGWITPEVVSVFESTMKSLGKSVEIYMYDAVHAFANPSNPKHDPEATKDAKEKALNFLKTYFK